jgi:hypothetical protein
MHLPFDYPNVSNIDQQLVVWCGKLVSGSRMPLKAKVHRCPAIKFIPGGEILWRLLTAMQQDDQGKRKRLSLIAAGDEEPVGTAARQMLYYLGQILCPPA